MATEQGEAFAAWLRPQLDPEPATEPVSEPVQEQPRSPRPDLSQGARGVPAASPDGVSVLVDLLASTERSPFPGGWYDVHDVKTGGPYNQHFKRT